MDNKRLSRMAALAAGAMLAMTMSGAAAPSEPGGAASPEPAGTLPPISGGAAPSEPAGTPPPVSEGAEPTDSGAAAPSGQVEASDPQSIVSAMQEMGFLATLDKDDVGDPLVSSRISATRFKIFFYGCDQNVNCDSIQFSAGYDLTEKIASEKVNGWNEENRWTKVYLDEEEDPFIEMDLYLGQGGVTPENFTEWLDIWRVQVEEFEDYIDF